MNQKLKGNYFDRRHAKRKKQCAEENTNEKQCAESRTPPTVGTRTPSWKKGGHLLNTPINKRNYRKSNVNILTFGDFKWLREILGIFLTPSMYTVVVTNLHGGTPRGRGDVGHYSNARDSWTFPSIWTVHAMRIVDPSLTQPSFVKIQPDAHQLLSVECRQNIMSCLVEYNLFAW